METAAGGAPTHAKPLSDAMQRLARHAYYCAITHVDDQVKAISPEPFRWLVAARSSTKPEPFRRFVSCPTRARAPDHLTRELGGTIQYCAVLFCSPAQAALVPTQRELLNCKLQSIVNVLKRCPF